MTNRIDTIDAQTDHAHEGDPEIARIVWQMAAIGVALMGAAAGLLWWHYGPVIFFDTLAALQSCF